MEDYNLKKMVSNAQARAEWYKNELETVFKNKTYFHPDIPEDLRDWWKTHLREMKNMSETSLKNLVLEAQYFNAGLNPPFMYPNAKPLKTEFAKIYKDKPVTEEDKMRIGIARIKSLETNFEFDNDVTNSLNNIITTLENKLKQYENKD